MSEPKDKIEKIIDEINEHERLTGRRVSYGEWIFRTRGMKVIVMPKRENKKRRNYTPWSDEEIKRLKKLVLEQRTTAEIAKELDRTMNSVYKKIIQDGLYEEWARAQKLARRQKNEERE